MATDGELLMPTSASSCNVRASVRFWITTGAGRALPKSINTAWQRPWMVLPTA